MLSTLFMPQQGERFARSSVDSAYSKIPALPAWPLYTLLYGFPLIWALGLGQFAPTILAIIMVFYMVVRRNILVYKTQWIWFALIFWCVVSTVSLHGGSDILAWGLRWVNILNVGIYGVYFFNARTSITNQGLMGGLVTVWYTVVILGYLALLFPEFRLTTPMSFLLPGGLKQNELVRDYVMPPLAEIQLPWGAPEPYIRPSAPFPYANSWGLAFTFLTPVVIATLMAADKLRTKIILGISIILGLVPAIATSNRGMFIGLGIAVVYVVLRYVLSGNLKVAFYSVVAAALAVAGLFASGAIAKILGRQEYSDSTGGRASLYQATWDAVMQSPVVGYGTSRMNVSIGISMGTQGYLWALMFCFGLVGLALFVIFMLSSIISTWDVQSAAGLWIHSVPVTAICVFIFYSFDIMQMAAMMLCLTMIMRSQVNGEGI
ncbi:MULTISPECIES: O-antigen ligase family protein [Rothia]|uniref:O-antigen ligase family protein n=1 Tax=Rothia TaxID=32207 RepID=UPI000A4328E3|nr:O-antigen ligase family protein [Rothia sp. ND6WE1A]